MTDFTKAYCNLHPHELITNFCAKGTPPLTKINVWWDSAPTASAPTRNPMSKRALRPTTKIFVIPARGCRSVFVPR